MYEYNRYRECVYQCLLFLQWAKRRYIILRVEMITTICTSLQTSEDVIFWSKLQADDFVLNNAILQISRQRLYLLDEGKFDIATAQYAVHGNSSMPSGSL